MEKTLAISACLLGINCTYVGGNNFHEAYQKWLSAMDFAKVIPLCPEQLGGLPTPRSPVEITWLPQGGFIALTREGTDTTVEFEKGGQEALKICRLFGVTHALLKSRSPSCGSGKIYSGDHSQTLVEGDGVAAYYLKKGGIQVFGTDEIIEQFS